MARLRAIRALLSLAVAWGLVWLVVSSIAVIVEARIRGLDFQFRFPQDYLNPFGWGAFCGFAFGLVLAASERRRRFEALSLARIGIWGAGGATLFPLVIALGSGYALAGSIRPLVVYAVLGAG